MTFLDWARVANVFLFVLVAVLFGTVNWLRRDVTDQWDAMARIGSEALFICLAYGSWEALSQDAPTGPRLLPVAVCLLLITVAYSVLLTKMIRARKKNKDA